MGAVKTTSRSKRPTTTARRKRRRPSGSDESLNTARAVDLFRLADGDFGGENIECLVGFDSDALAAVPQF